MHHNNPAVLWKHQQWLQMFRVVKPAVQRSVQSQRRDINQVLECKKCPWWKDRSCKVSVANEPWGSMCGQKSIWTRNMKLPNWNPEANHLSSCLKTTLHGKPRKSVSSARHAIQLLLLLLSRPPGRARNTVLTRQSSVWLKVSMNIRTGLLKCPRVWRNLSTPSMSHKLSLQTLVSSQLASAACVPAEMPPVGLSLTVRLHARLFECVSPRRACTAPACDYPFCWPQFGLG